MFCPLGYTSLIKIMEENFIAFDWDKMNMEKAFQLVFEDREGEISAWRAKTLSTQELIEKTVFENAYSAGIFMCSPKGKLLKIEAPFFEMDTWFHEIKKNTPQFFDELHHFLAGTGIESTILDEIDSLLAQNKDPWFELKDTKYFCSVNYFYSRDDYTISTEVFRILRSLSDYSFPYTKKVSMERMEPFEGWALCVSDKTAEILKPANLDEKLKIKFLATALWMDEERISSNNKNSQMTVGRPKVREEAARAFLKYFSMDDRPSWKEVVRTLKDKEGIDVSDRSIQRGLSELISDKKAT